ncbi:hypothetical protein [Nonomuraea endophytica]|uniref:Uncharacterized protein n=1 Tax=Nonomuraea endophytica TaxID=714136 RepID=A0A7W8EL44_9ACTN|nr:hypothetical protein [Nonomuraea endophytica]MBB5083484.1 hypothetical protein [Nonomuraea endophytica]
MPIRDVIPAGELPDPAANFPDLWHSDAWQALLRHLQDQRWTRGQINGCLLLNSLPMIPYHAFPEPTKAVYFMSPMSLREFYMDWDSTEWQAVLRRYHERGVTAGDTRWELHHHGIPILNPELWQLAWKRAVTD